MSAEGAFRNLTKRVQYAIKANYRASAIEFAEDSIRLLVELIPRRREAFDEKR
ncbi:hypothetical protein ACPFP2_12305 [Micromonospora citrea]|uniref:hypothetical protein n=1 Tax=Micromonospora citrea TaxID=47855 RepID=UPI003C371EA1